MTDDLLKAATRALQDETADDAADGRFTRARVMASLHQGKVKRRTRLAFILPVAACLAAGTAWGAATGRLPAVFHAVGQFVGYNSQTSEPKPAPHGKAPAKTPVPVAEHGALAQAPPPPPPEVTPDPAPAVEEDVVPDEDVSAPLDPVDVNVSADTLSVLSAIRLEERLADQHPQEEVIDPAEEEEGRQHGPDDRPRGR